MARSGYSDDCTSSAQEHWALIRWRGQVASAIRGKRGQALLRDLKAALEAMPAKRLIRDDLVCPDGVCALGALGQARGLDLADVDPFDREAVAQIFGVAEALAAEIVDINDYGGTPEQRWERVHAWVTENLQEAAP